MEDKYEDLEKLFDEKIEEVEEADYNALIKICEQENLDYEDLTEEEIRKELLDYFNEEIED